jgi:transcription initiation factor TFIIIB Brf1 subunit/transcription initiation factor TFIIB
MRCPACGSTNTQYDPDTETHDCMDCGECFDEDDDEFMYDDDTDDYSDEE